MDDYTDYGYDYTTDYGSGDTTDYGSGDTGTDWTATDSGLNVSTDDTSTDTGDTGGTGNESGTDLQTPDEATAEAVQARDDFYRSIGLDPESLSDMPPADQAEIDAIIAGDAYKADPGLIKTLMGAFKKTVNGQSVTDWGKVGLVGGLLAKATGLSKVETPGYKGTVKNFTAVNAPITYNDPNRRPGAQGRSYFTPTQFVDPANAGPAQAAADQQAQGIMASYTPAAAPTPKWTTTNAVAMPWNKPAAPAAAAPVEQTPVMTPEQKLQSVNAASGGIMAAKGRYLRGHTDGMADKINTSIDNHQPAKLSHGEFVVPADVVSHLGNGNSDAGAKKLYQMMDKIRIARTGTKQQGKRINPDKFLPGGAVGYSSGGITDVAPKRFTAGGPATNTTTAGNLSEWVGDYATTAIGQGGAAADQPYQAYKGPLTAGASDLQQQQFAGLSGIASAGLTPTTYSTGMFDANAANKYMNPYLTAALDPQLAELKRQSDIARLSDASRLTQAGAYGGSRQAIMESEGRRNLLDKQKEMIGSGYNTAYDKAMAQYNADMGRQLQTEQAQQAANEASANFGLKSMDALGQAGATQRGIEAEGIAADKAQFEEQRDWDKKMAQYKMGLLQGMPVATQANTTNTNPITDWLTTGAGITELLNRFKAV